MSNTKRFVHFEKDGKPRWGLRDYGQLKILSGAPWAAECRETGEAVEFGSVKVLPAAQPTKIIAFGYNYRDLFQDKNARVRSDEPHFTDKGFEPVIFLKGPNALSAHECRLPLSPNLEEVWVEVELALVIGKKISKARSIEEAKAALFGVTIANDVTALNIYGRDWHLARSKSLDGFCPVGPEIVTGIDAEDLPLHMDINGSRTQSSRTSQRVLKSAQSIQFLSQLMTLEPGDVILTGTPFGARQSRVRPGDSVEATIEGVGALRTHFVPQEPLNA